MIIKCPHCGADIEIDYESDLEATMWNFDGKEADIEMNLYCENCEKCCMASVHYEMQPVGEITLFKG
jgi:Fe2+ or Zn2+ uptake regulation protein